MAVYTNRPALLKMHENYFSLLFLLFWFVLFRFYLSLAAAIYFSLFFSSPLNLSSKWASSFFFSFLFLFRALQQLVTFSGSFWMKSPKSYFLLLEENFFLRLKTFKAFLTVYYTCIPTRTHASSYLERFFILFRYCLCSSSIFLVSKLFSFSLSHSHTQIAFHCICRFRSF